MLPVSGAEQLKISDAQNTRPMISASGAYSRLVSRVPGSSSRETGQEQVPEPLGARRGLERLDHRRREDARLDLVLPGADLRHDPLLHEPPEPGAQLLDLRRIGEIHRCPPDRDGRRLAQAPAPWPVAPGCPNAKRGPKARASDRAR